MSDLKCSTSPLRGILDTDKVIVEGVSRFVYTLCELSPKGSWVKMRIMVGPLIHSEGVRRSNQPTPELWMPLDFPC